MLRLLSLLQTHRYWAGRDLADRLGVSPRTLRRDVDRLRELGYPVDATRGAAGGYQLRAGAALPPLLLDDEEAVAVAVSLHTAAGGLVAGVEETAVRALSKIIQVLPPRLRRQADAVYEYTVPVIPSGPAVDAVALSTLAQACRDDERLEFDYRRWDGETGRRRVEPHRLVLRGRRWYLVAWDLERHDWRSFRVDRLSSPHSTGVRFRQRELPVDDAAEFVATGIASVRSHTEVVVRAFTTADVVRRVAGRWAEVRPLDEGTCRIVLRVETFDWPVMLLAGIDADFEVISPPEFAAHLRTIGERFARQSVANS